MAATPAAIEVNLTIVFVLFVSADVILTRNSEMKAHTSKMDSYSSSIYMNVLPTSLAQTSYHLAPISHLKCLSVQFSSHIHYSYYYGASVLERCVFHRSRIRGARFIVPIPFIAFPRHKNYFLTVYILPKNPFRVPSEMQLQLLAKKKPKPNLL
uniref:Cell wall mannoprotein n=1 Tax=Saccharomyces bayanus TaxID=4931 RepID=F2Q9E4_SACBA|nr:cell wall mannoprotein [Saccharomyces bayanus]